MSQNPCESSWGSADYYLSAGIGAFKQPLRPIFRSDFGPGNGPKLPFPFCWAQKNMNADTLHAALGVAFTAIWLIVGQILVGNR